MARIRSPDCDCDNAPDLSVSESGEAVSFTGTYALRVDGALVRSATLDITFDAFTRKDRMLVSIDSFQVWDSGCIAGSSGASVEAPAGSQYVSVEIIGECDPSETTPPTAWVFSLECSEARC
jgi:hypothetical protein